MKIDTGNTAWVLASAALVLFMTPGLAFFYGGMVRAKNVLAMLMQNFFSMGLVSVLWAVVGYSLAFGGRGKFIGNFDFAWHAATSRRRARPDSSVDDPAAVVLVVPADVRDHHARADHRRDRRPHEVLGVGLVPRPVVDPRVRAGRALGVLAGGLAVRARRARLRRRHRRAHQRRDRRARRGARAREAARAGPKHPMPPHSLPFTLLGTGILWFGWFGFNAGSALAADGDRGAGVRQHVLAAAAAMLGWLVVERLKAGHATTLGAASGAVAGLVAITPCAGFVGRHGADLHRRSSPASSASSRCSLKFKFGYDDSLDVVGVHLVGGIVGSLLLGLFADAAVNSAGTATACSSRRRLEPVRRAGARGRRPRSSSRSWSRSSSLKVLAARDARVASG